MRFGSVCSGIEAASVAWPFWDAAWFSEIEPFPCAVLAHHYPQVPNYGDMTLLPERILSGEVEAPDVFCGGTPCQAFSVAGNRQSLSDKRGNLSLTFCEIADAIDAVRYVRGSEPAVVFWENVPGVLNTSDNAFGCFLAKLAGESCELQPPGGRWTDAGVVHGPKRSIAWRVLDAQFFSLAQRRKRVFVVASAREGFNPAEVLFEFDGLRRDTAPSREAGQGTAAYAERSPVCAEISPTVLGFENSRRDGVRLYDGVTHTLQSFMGTGGGNTPCVTYGIQGNMIGRADTAGPQGSGYGEEVGYTLTKTDVHGVVTVAPPHAFKIRGGCEGGGKGYLGMDEQVFTITTGHDQQIAVPTDSFICAGCGKTILDSWGWGEWCDFCGHGHAEQAGVPFTFGIDEECNAGDNIFGPLLRGGQGGTRQAVATQYAARRLTPTECERLQGFPDGYTNIPWRNKPEAPDGPRYKALGNSWAVPCVTWIGNRINQHLESLA